jgi:hypothetical protein
MYNQAELAALTSNLSNDARVLYCLLLRVGVNKTTGTTPPFQYKQAIGLLNSYEKHYKLGREINELLQQLENCDLVELPGNLSFDQSLNGEVLILPLAITPQDDFAHYHQQFMPMSMQWQPAKALCEMLADLLGLIDSTFNDEDIGEFVAYWLGRPQSIFSQYQWNQKFIYSLKRKRTATDTNGIKKVGNQIVKSISSVEADDNARKLVEKYSQTKKI